VPVYWDNGPASNHSSGLFDRATGAQAYADVINAIVSAAK
jgi:endoglucanase